MYSTCEFRAFGWRGRIGHKRLPDRFENSRGGKDIIAITEVATIGFYEERNKYVVAAHQALIITQKITASERCSA